MLHAKAEHAGASRHDYGGVNQVDCEMAAAVVPPSQYQALNPPPGPDVAKP